MKGVDIIRTDRFDEDRIDMNIDENTTLTIQFYDISGDNSATVLIDSFAARANMIVICYAINSLQSFNDVEEKWLDAINKHDRARFLPIALIATKSDV